MNIKRCIELQDWEKEIISFEIAFQYISKRYEHFQDIICTPGKQQKRGKNAKIRNKNRKKNID